MIDELTNLSFSLHHNKGAYALLLGSGISRSSGIPTGFDITKDLIRQLAQLQYGDDCSADPVIWYKEKFGKEPNYSDIIDNLAATQVERSKLLRPYFEPSEEEKERDEQLKKPNAAHKAIAKMVSSGHIKVIISTNFDRLLEMALEEEGITPTVISNEDDILGASPIIHSNITIIKVHGDYKDTRIKNTVSELENYSSNLNSLLDNVFANFGLLICGWSADWDIALKNSIFRAFSRRYSAFWLLKGNASTEITNLSNHLKAKVININDASEIFDKINHSLVSIETLSKPHPLDQRVLVETFKRLLNRPEQKIALRELILTELKPVVEKIEPIYANILPNPLVSYVYNAITEYDALIDNLIALCCVGAFYGEGDAELLLIYLFQTLIDIKATKSHHPDVALDYYPGFVILYALCVSSILANNYKLVRKALYTVEIIKRSWGVSRDKVSVRGYLTRFNVVSGTLDLATFFNTKFYPLNSHILQLIKKHLTNLVSRDTEIDRAFDEFEILFNIAYRDFHGNPEFLPGGIFAFKIIKESYNPLEEFKAKLNDGVKNQHLLSDFFCCDQEKAMTNFSSTEKWINEVLLPDIQRQYTFGR